MGSVSAALDAVRRDVVHGAMVPLENSVEGAVPATLDELAVGEPLMITTEVLLPIAFSLLVRPGMQLADVKTIASHPHALPQVRRWLASNLSDAEWHAAASNADAARRVQEGQFDAALAGSFAAQHYQLVPLHEDIHDRAEAVTRFVLVSKFGRPPLPTGADRTTLVVFPRDTDRPGSLVSILQECSTRGVNLTRIESRPVGSKLGEYHFSIDFDGHVEDASVGEALMGLRRVCADVRFLGSYPRADGIARRVFSGTSEQDFANAACWLARLRQPLPDV
jgi:prephenate dehydratase